MKKIIFVMLGIVFLYGCNSNNKSDTIKIHDDCEIKDYQKEALDLINDIRVNGAQCGNLYYEPKEPLTYSCEIEKAAELHSLDMASNNFFSHIGSDGLRVGSRLKQVDDVFKFGGENIAAGFNNTKEVVDAWLKSDKHCEVIMYRKAELFSIYKVDVKGSDYSNYWTMVVSNDKK